MTEIADSIIVFLLRLWYGPLGAGFVDGILGPFVLVKNIFLYGFPRSSADLLAIIPPYGQVLAASYNITFTLSCFLTGLFMVTRDIKGRLVFLHRLGFLYFPCILLFWGLTAYWLVSPQLKQGVNPSIHRNFVPERPPLPDIK